MKTDIFIKSYAKDFEWLHWCLKSIHKFCKGFDEIVIVVPEQDKAQLKLTQERVVGVKERENGYVFQQVVKLCCNDYLSGDNVLYVDSDCMFTKHVTPETYFKDEKPYILHTDYNKIETPWQPGVEYTFKRGVKYEFMRRHPEFYPLEVIRAFRLFIHKFWEMDIEQFMYQVNPIHPLSEFNLLGAYSWFYYRDYFTFLNTETDEIPEETLIQHWSYSGPRSKENAVRFSQAMAALNS